MTTAQQKKIDALLASGWKWDKILSEKTAGVILIKGDDQWFFGLSGEIIENPHKW